MKAYAPRINHIVVDVECRPQDAAWEETMYATQHSTSTSDEQKSVPEFTSRRVPIITSPTHDAFWSHIYTRGLPTVIRGQHMGTCTSTWTPQYLYAHASSERTIVSVHVCPTQHMDFVNKNFVSRCVYVLACVGCWTFAGCGTACACLLCFVVDVMFDAHAHADVQNHDIS